MIEEDEEDVDLMTVSVTLQRAFEKGRQEGKQEGKQEGIELGEKRGIELGEKQGERRAVTGMLHQLFTRHAGRPPTDAEQKALSARVQAGDPDEVQHLALNLEGERLIAWMTAAT